MIGNSASRMSFHRKCNVASGIAKSKKKARLTAG